MKEDSFKERISECLRKNQDGMTIMDIAESTGINRITVSKYVLVLLAEGMIEQRRVGTAKLCYAKGKK